MIYRELITSDDVRLKRHIEHDERSRHFDVVANPLDWFHAVRLARSTHSSVTWQRFSPILDQGQVGSCTGNAIAGLLGCAPFATEDRTTWSEFDELFAVDVYSKATIVDGFPGRYPPTDTGSSGLAVAKVVKSEGLITKYLHAFTLPGLIHALQTGPVIVGVPWYHGFYTPDADGLVTVGGSIVGGHEFVVREWNASSHLFTADNSWGQDWGSHGSFSFSASTWNILRANKADVTVPRR